MALNVHIVDTSACVDTVYHCDGLRESILL